MTNTNTTGPAGSLTRQQVRFFRDVGYLRLPTMLEPEELGELREVSRRVLDSAHEPVERAADGRIVKVLGIVDRDERFAATARAAPLVDALQSLLGPNVELLKNRHNHLTSGRGSEGAGRLHRDVLQWSRTVITALVFLDDTRSLESATRILPGSQFLPFVGRPNNGGTWLDEHGLFADLADQAVPLPADAGDVLLLDGVAFHQSGPAAAKHERLCLTFAFRAVDELEPPGEAAHRELISGEDLYRGNEGAAVRQLMG